MWDPTCDMQQQAEKSNCRTPNNTWSILPQAVPSGPVLSLSPYWGRMKWDPRLDIADIPIMADMEPETLPDQNEILEAPLKMLGVEMKLLHTRKGASRKEILETIRTSMGIYIWLPYIKKSFLIQPLVIWSLECYFRLGDQFKQELGLKIHTTTRKYCLWGQIRIPLFFQDITIVLTRKAVRDHQFLHSTEWYPTSVKPGKEVRMRQKDDRVISQHLKQKGT